MNEKKRKKWRKALEIILQILTAIANVIPTKIFRR